MNKTLAAILISGSFALGVSYSEDVRNMKSFLNEKVSETSYERPYHLRVINVETNNGIETYLYDPISKRSKKVLRGMQLEERYSAVDLALDLYNLVIR